MKGELLKLLLRHIRIKMIQKYIPKNCVFCDIGCGFNSTFIRAIFKHIISGLGFGKKIKSNAVSYTHLTLPTKRIV